MPLDRGHVVDVDIAVAVCVAEAYAVKKDVRDMVLLCVIIGAGAVPYAEGKGRTVVERRSRYGCHAFWDLNVFQRSAAGKGAVTDGRDVVFKQNRFERGTLKECLRRDLRRGAVAETHLIQRRAAVKHAVAQRLNGGRDLDSLEVDASGKGALPKAVEPGRVIERQRLDRFVSEKREGLDRGHIITEKFFADDDIAFGALIGFQVGDRVIAVDNTEVTSVSDLKAILSEHAVGDTLSFELERDGRTGTIDLTLEEYSPAATA